MSRIEKLISQQRKAFDEIVYHLTESGLKPGERLRRLDESKKRAKKLLAELMTQYQELPESTQEQKEDREKLKSFIVSLNNEYKKVMSNTTDQALGEDKLEESQYMPKSSTNNKQKSQETKYSTLDATQYTNLVDNLLLNTSLGTKIIDGETIPDTHNDDLFFVIEPFTNDTQIIVTRFLNVDALQTFVHNNYKRSNIQPVIIYGKQANLKYTINVEI